MKRNNGRNTIPKYILWHFSADRGQQNFVLATHTVGGIVYDLKIPSSNIRHTSLVLTWH